VNLQCGWGLSEGGMVVVDVVCGAETCARERKGEEVIIGQM